MVEEYSARFLIDEFFIRDILTDFEVAKEVIKNLSKIHTNSRSYQLLHNQMFDFSFKESIKDKIIRGHALLGAIHPVPFPSFVKENDPFETKLIKYAIDLASKKPYEVIILTSQEKAKDYYSNQHYNNEQVKSAIKIVFGEEALSYIKIVCNKENSNNN